MKKGILIIGLVFAGLGLLHVKMARARDLNVNLQNFREVREISLDHFFHDQGSRTYAHEDSSSTFGNEDNSYRKICAADARAKACRKVVEDGHNPENYDDGEAECHQRCEEDHPGHNQNVIIQEQFDICILFCASNTLRDETPRHDLPLH